jgi:hypothetical protein
LIWLFQVLIFLEVMLRRYFKLDRGSAGFKKISASCCKIFSVILYLIYSINNYLSALALANPKK